MVRHGIAHVPEGRGVVTELTVDENLRLGGLWRRSRRPELRRDLRPVPAARQPARATSATSSPAASGRCWRSAGRWPPSRGCCCSTSRRSGSRPKVTAQIMGAAARPARPHRPGRAAGRAERAQRAVHRRRGRRAGARPDRGPRSRPPTSPTTPISGTPTWGSDMDRFLYLTFDGLSRGAVYAAFALALVLIWRAARIVNFAQGAMAVATAYAGYSVAHRDRLVLARLRGRDRRRPGARRGGRAGGDAVRRPFVAAQRRGGRARPGADHPGRARDDLRQRVQAGAGAVQPGRVRDRRGRAALPLRPVRVRRGGRGGRPAHASFHPYGDRPADARGGLRARTSPGCSGCRSAGC